jgi:hypothetical protein
MQMGDALARILTAIGHDAVSALFNALLLSDRPGGAHELCYERVGHLVQLIHARYMTLGHDESVHGSLGRDIGNGEDFVVFIQFCGWNFSIHYTAEYAGFVAWHCDSSLRLWRRERRVAPILFVQSMADIRLTALARG